MVPVNYSKTTDFFLATKFNSSIYSCTTIVYNNDNMQPNLTFHIDVQMSCRLEPPLPRERRFFVIISMWCFSGGCLDLSG